MTSWRQDRQTMHEDRLPSISSMARGRWASVRFEFKTDQAHRAVATGWSRMMCGWSETAGCRCIESVLTVKFIATGGHRQWVGGAAIRVEHSVLGRASPGPNGTKL